MNSLADSLRLPYLSIQQIIQGKAPMTADVDLRLCRYFGLSDGYFLRDSQKIIDPLFTLEITRIAHSYSSNFLK